MAGLSSATKHPTRSRRIEAGLLLIRREPGVGVPVRYGRHSNVRRLYLERVRYLIYYQVVPYAIRVLAIRHASRRPSRL